MTQPLHTQEYFHTALEDLSLAIDTHAVALDEVAEQKYVVKQARDQQRDLEAEIIVNGGTTMYRVSPDMNQAKRDAVIRMALKNDAAYQAALAVLNTAEKVLDKLEAKRDAAANRMGLAKRKADAYLAAAEQQSAVLQFRDGERRRELAGRR